MAKISTYPTADTPLLLSDRLIGTEAIKPIPSLVPLATKNFSLGELLQLFSSNFPAASLQAVLDTNNTATQDIYLTGRIESDVIKPINIEDPTGNQGATYQVITKGASSISWANVPIDGLQDVLNTQNVATKDMFINGNITSSFITPKNIKDESLNTGTIGQVLTKSSLGVVWANSPAGAIYPLNEVLFAGNTATNDINLTGNIYATTFIKSGGVSSEFLKANGSVDSTVYVPETRTLTINGTTQDLSANRTFTIATGLTVGTTPITSGTVGRVLFEGTGNVLQESANLFWDNTNSRLGIGTASPTSSLNVRGAGTSSATTTLLVQNSAGTSMLQLRDDNYQLVGNWLAIESNRYIYRALNASGIFTICNDSSVGTFVNLYGSSHATLANVLDLGTASTSRLRIAANGNVLIGTTTDAGFRLDVNGTARVSGNTTISGNLYKTVDTGSLGLYGGPVGGTLDGFIKIHGASNFWGMLQFNMGYDSTNSRMTWTISDTTELMRLTGGGNLLLGTATNAGFKLDVNGTARFVSDIRSTTGVYIGTTATFAGVFPSGTAGRETVNIRGGLFPSDIGIDVVISNAQGDVANTTSNRTLLSLSRGFNPTSGSGIYNVIQINPTINQTGGASGASRGLFINPTLTAAADFRAIETTAGNVLFGASGTGFFWDNANGRLGVGTASPLYRLDVTGNSRFLNDLIVGNTTAAPNLQLGPPSSANYGATLKLLGYNSTFKNWELSVGLRGQNFNITPSATDGGTTFTTPALSITTGSNVLIGTTTDAGYKLDVNGTARVRSSFETQGVTGLNNGTFYVGNNFVTSYGQSIGFFGAAVASAIVEIQSTTKGLLFPRMTNAQRLAIASPAVGLIVYCTDMVEGLYVNKSTGWTFVI